MPKVSEAHRDARRRQIANAAIVCLRRDGVSNTSMADIIAESGLSAGAIYSNFRNKAELAAYVARMLISARAAYFTSTGDHVKSPREVAVGMLEALRGDDVPFAVVLQFWAEATVDAEMHTAVSGTVAELRAEVSRAIEPWVRLHYPEDVQAQTARFAAAMLSASQGYILNAALFGPGDPHAHLESLALALRD